MQTTVRTALQLGPGEHVIRVRHASGGWFTMHPLTVSAAQAMAGAAGGQAGAVAAELGILAERTPTPTLLSVSPSPATVGDTISISGIINTALGLGGAASGTAAAQATPLVLERSPTPILSSVSPNPATVGVVLTISGSVDGQLAVSGVAAGQAAAAATITVVRSLAGAAAGVGGASAIGLTVTGAPPASLVPNNPGFSTATSSTAIVNGAWYFASDLVGPGTVVGSATNGYATISAASDEFEGTSAASWLRYRWVAEEVSAAAAVSDSLTFDFYRTSGDPYVDIMAFDSGLAMINSYPGARRSLSSFNATLNTWVSATTSVRAFIESTLSAGKTWADVSLVMLSFGVEAQPYSPAEVRLDNFR